MIRAIKLVLGWIMAICIIIPVLVGTSVLLLASCAVVIAISPLIAVYGILTNQTFEEINEAYNESKKAETIGVTTAGKGGK